MSRSMAPLCSRGLGACHWLGSGWTYPQNRPPDGFAKMSGAVEKTRTSTAFRPQRPQRCASTSSATTARDCRREVRRWQERASSKGSREAQSFPSRLAGEVPSPLPLAGEGRVRVFRRWPRRMEEEGKEEALTSFSPPQAGEEGAPNKGTSASPPRASAGRGRWTRRRGPRRRPTCGRGARCRPGHGL